jgi:hypothetical protein
MSLEDDLSIMPFRGEEEWGAQQEKIDQKWPLQTLDHPNPEVLMVNPQWIFLWFKLLGQIYNPSKHYIHHNDWEKVISR